MSARAPADMVRQAIVNGRPIAYRRAGAGDALVLLHGFIVDSRSWRPQLEALSDTFTVIAWDAPGTGRTADPDVLSEFADWADTLAGLLDSLDLRKAHIVGLSWGGILAQELYRRHRTRVSSLVLADTYAGWKGSLPEPVVEARLAACLRDAALPADEFVARYLPSMFSPSAPAEIRAEMARIMADFHPGGFRLMAGALARADTRDLLPTIEVPTLLVWGEADARSPMGIAYQLRDAIPGSELVVIGDAGHVSNLEQSARFNEAVRAFYANLSPGS